MRRALKWTLILGLAVSSSHAIVGLGAHWAPNAGFTSNSENLPLTVGGQSTGITFRQEAVEGLQGIGFKAWIDFLPFVDVEGTVNMQWGTYAATISKGPDTLGLNWDLGVPLAPEEPIFFQSMADVSVQYPFLKLPPLVSLVKLYAGAGLTLAWASEIMNSTFAKSAMEDQGMSATTSLADVQAALVEQIKEKGLSSGAGMHVMLGAKAKPPIVPLAAYANLKYYLVSALPDAVDSPGFTLELGGALAF